MTSLEGNEQVGQGKDLKLDLTRREGYTVLPAE